jgi:hypothetical protein
MSLIAGGRGPTAMSLTVKGILGATAMSLTLGAVQFASGRDLTSGLVTTGLAATGLSTARNSVQDSGGVNRAAKADRVAAATAAAVPTRTISIRLDRLADTSILIRIPAVKETRNLPPAPLLIKPGDRKLKVACEPVVSTLTEVAKLLQPGRCVT